MDATVYVPASKSTSSTVIPHHLQDDCDSCKNVKWNTVGKHSFTSWSDQSSICLRFVKSPPKIPSHLKEEKCKDRSSVSFGAVIGHKRYHLEKIDGPYKRTQWFLSKVSFGEINQETKSKDLLHRLRFIVSIFTKDKKFLRKIWKKIVKKIAEGSFPSCNTCLKPEDNIIIVYTYSKQQRDMETFLMSILPDDSAVRMEVL